MAYDPHGDRLFATLAGSNELLEVDPYSGVPSLVGIMDDRTWGLAFDSQTDTLYGVTMSGSSLVRIDLADASQTLIGTEGGIGTVEGLAFSPDNGSLYAVLLGGSPMLASIDPLDGTVSPIGSTGTEHFISGLAFTPEPGSLAFLLLGTVLAARPVRTCCTQSRRRRPNGG